MLNLTRPIDIMAEIKLRSPSGGVLGSATEIITRAKAYQQAKVDVISVITEPKCFGGDTAFIPLLKKHVQLPILQKDFITSIDQIVQAKTLGSDALLLIANLVPSKILSGFVDACLELRIEPVVEVFDRADLESAIKTNTRTIAVNARNLATLTVNVPHACQLIKKIPRPFMKLGFSGIKGPEDVEQYVESGAAGVLVGTSLMQAKNIQGFITNLRNI